MPNQYTNTEQPWHDEELLHELFVDRELSLTAISSELNCSRETVKKYLDRHDIGDRYPCPSCDRSFFARNGAAKHHKDEHGETLRELEAKRGEYPCPECDVAFDSTQALNSHRGHAHDISVGVVCKYCGDTTFHNPSVAPEREYCDENCMAAAYEEITGSDHPKHVQKIQKTCTICNEPYEAYPYRADQRKTCGRPECKYESVGRQNRGENSPLFAQIEVACANCNSPLMRARWRVERNNKHFCVDKPCQPEWMAENLSGENNPCFNGGAFPYGPGFHEGKKEAVRERDGRVCQHPDCSRTEKEHVELFGRKHSVHHIQKARTFDDPENRNSMANLITLCEHSPVDGELSCHQKWELLSPLRLDGTPGID